jgi:hypothetical protein
MPAPDWVVAPRYQGRALAGALFAAARRCGLELPPMPGDPAPPDVDQAGGPAGSGPAGSGPAAGVVLVMADGLGLANLEARRGHAAALWAMDRQEWRCGFPATTVASLGTLGTGRPPGQTALAGYSLRDPATGRRAALIKWDTPTPPETWQPLPTVFERLAQAGHVVRQIGESRFADSAMTRSSLRGGEFHGVKHPDQRAPLAADLARRGGGVIYLYWGELDKEAHRQGWQSPAWGRALESLDAAVRELLRTLPPGWEVWLTSDHGVVDAGPRWDVAQHHQLLAGVGMVAGEGRALHLYTSDAEGVASRWSDLLGDAAWVMTKDQAVEAGLFGPVSARVRPYLGDVVVAMAGTGVVVDSRHMDASALAMVGQHGSLTEPEMSIPFLRAA